MAREHRHPHHDRDPDQPEHAQQGRRYEQAKDYFKLRRFRFDFGREFNATNYWDEARSRNPAPPPSGDTGGVTRGRR